jgi:hypothetical protein
MKFRARVFKKDGNHFLIPGYWHPEDDAGWDGMSPLSILCDGMMMSVVCGFDGKEEWRDFEATDDGRADLVNIPYRLVGRQFAHGAIDVLLIGGPLFDEALAKQLDPVS